MRKSGYTLRISKNISLFHDINFIYQIDITYKIDRSNYIPLD